MLREFKNITQHPGEHRRRWFTSAYLDLFVWFGDDDSIQAFELCYGKPAAERVLTWTQGSGRYRHQRVGADAAEALQYKMTPVYLPDGTFDRGSVSERFAQESQGMDTGIRGFVLEKLAAFSSENVY